MSDLVISMDPGIRQLGIAAMLIDKKKFTCEVLHAEIVKPEKSITKWFMRLESALARVDEIIFDVTELAQRDTVFYYCEEPQVMSGTRGGATARRGDVVHLAHCMGMFHSLASRYGPFPFVFEPVNIPKWKGNAKDEVVQPRVAKAVTDPVRLRLRLNLSNYKLFSHSLDAVGVGICGHCNTDITDKRWFS